MRGFLNPSAPKFKRQSVPGLTIDGFGAHDFDDAVWVDQLPSGEMRVYISITDVAEKVTKGSLVDQTARKRGATIYPGGGCKYEPMFSSGALVAELSLMPYQERPTVTVFLTIKDGKLLSTRIGLTKVSSCGRYTYEQFGNKVQNEGDSLGRQFGLLLKVAKVLHAHRTGSDEPSLQRIGESFRNDDGEAFEVEEREHLGRFVIMESMLAANIAMADFLDEANVPFPHRNCLPLEEGGDTWLYAYGMATYDVVCLGHAALKVPRYAHGTSPIRRYPDVVLQRQLVAVLRKQTPPYLRSEVAEMCPDLTRLVRAAKQASKFGPDALHHQEQQLVEELPIPTPIRVVEAMSRETVPTLEDVEGYLNARSFSDPQPVIYALARALVDRAAELPQLLEMIRKKGHEKPTIWIALYTVLKSQKLVKEERVTVNTWPGALQQQGFCASIADGSIKSEFFLNQTGAKAQVLGLILEREFELEPWTIVDHSSTPIPPTRAEVLEAKQKLQERKKLLTDLNNRCRQLRWKQPDFRIESLGILGDVESFIGGLILQSSDEAELTIGPVTASNAMEVRLSLVELAFADSEVMQALWPVPKQAEEQDLAKAASPLFAPASAGKAITELVLIGASSDDGMRHWIEAELPEPILQRAHDVEHRDAEWVKKGCYLSLSELHAVTKSLLERGGLAHHVCLVIGRPAINARIERSPRIVIGVGNGHPETARVDSEQLLEGLSKKLEDYHAAEEGCVVAATLRISGDQCRLIIGWGGHSAEGPDLTFGISEKNEVLVTN